MKYRDTYRILTQVSRYVSHRDFRYRATPTSNGAEVEITIDEITFEAPANLHHPVLNS